MHACEASKTPNKLWLFDADIICFQLVIRQLQCVLAATDYNSLSQPRTDMQCVQQLVPLLTAAALRASDAYAPQSKKLVHSLADDVAKAYGCNMCCH